jgi:hypothetical protein
MENNGNQDFPGTDEFLKGYTEDNAVFAVWLTVIY